MTNIIKTMPGETVEVIRPDFQLAFMALAVHVTAAKYLLMAGYREESLASLKEAQDVIARVLHHPMVRSS